MGTIIRRVTVENTLKGDATHSTGANILGQSVIITYFKDVMTIIVLESLVFGIAFLWKRKRGWNQIFLAANIISLLMTMWFWFVQKTGYDGVKLYIPTCLLYALYSMVQCLKRKQSCMIPLMGICLGLGVFLNVIFVSNVPLINNLPFLLPAVIWGLVLICEGTKETSDGVAFLAVTCMAAVLGTLFTLQSSPAGTLVFDCDERISEGPAKGIFTSEFVASTYSEANRIFQEKIPDGSNVLIVTNNYYNTLLYYCYMNNHAKISHYSVNSTPTFTKHLEYYWLMFPEKYPDVIFINNTTFYQDTWILDYAEYYFDYDYKEESKYGNIYYRKKQ